MKVRMKTTAANARRIYEADKVYDIPSDTAQEWVELGFADKVSRDEPVTTAEVTTVEPQSKATRQRGPRRATG